MLIKKTLIATAALAAGMAAMTAEGASTATTTFQVKLTIQTSCTVAKTGDLNLGTHDGWETNLGTNASTFTVTCSKNTPYYIGLKSQATTADNNGAGAMKGTGSNNDTVAYTLYQDAASTVWGNTANS